MERTGVYWNSPSAARERAGLLAGVVNARHVNTVPGRNTEIADAQWRAILARAGWLRSAFIPPVERRNLRLIARQRQQLGGLLAAEQNRLHKLLSDAGLRLTVLISDLPGHAGRARVKAIMAGESRPERLKPTGRLKASRADLCEALQTEDLRQTHRLVLAAMLSHIDRLEAPMPRFEAQRLHRLAPWQALLVLLPTVPGIDQVGAAMRLVESGTDRRPFGSAERLASGVGICPGNHASAGKRTSGKTRQGHAWARRRLGEFAQAAARSRCGLKETFTALTIRQGHQQSIGARAHKILRIL